MTIPRPRGRPTGSLSALIAFMIFVALAVPSAPAEAGGLSVQDQVDAQLAAVPGGKQISSTEVSYGGGAFVVTLVRTEGSSVGADCPSGWFCFYDRVNYGYPRGKLSSCGWQDLAWWAWQDRTESVHYNLSSGSVSFINHGARTDHSDDRVLFSAGTGNRFVSDVGSGNRNVSDHVYRYC